MVVTRAMGVALATAAAVLAAAVPASAAESADQLTTGQSTAGVGAAQSDPMFFGLGPAGLFWLFAGLAALAVGMVLATRRTRSPVASRPGPDAGAAGPTNDLRPGGRAGISTTKTTTTTSNDEPGGAKK